MGQRSRQGKVTGHVIVQPVDENGTEKRGRLRVTGRVINQLVDANGTKEKNGYKKTIGNMKKW